jgi:hypothetical protein
MSREFGTGGDGGAGGRAPGEGGGGSCTSETEESFCARLGKNCGEVSAPDNCGEVRTVKSCGTCTIPGQVCGAGSPGVQGVCGVAPGTFLWARSTSAMTPLGLSESSTGVVVTGYFVAPADLGGKLLIPVGGADTAVAQFAINDAAHVYSTRFGGAGDEFGFLDTLDPSGSAVIRGVSYGNAQDLGQGMIAGGGGAFADGFVGRYGPSGPAWVRRLVGPGEDKFVASANGPNSTLYAAGWFEQTAMLAQTPNTPLTLTSAGYRDIVITQFNSFTGAPVLAKQFGGPSSEQTSGIAWTGSQIVVSGFFDGTTTFKKGLSITTVGALDVWAAAFMPDGTPLWAARFGGAGDDRSAGLAVDTAGDIYLSGDFVGQVAFGATKLTAVGGHDVFLAKLSGKTGGVIWATSVGSTGDDGCGAPAINAAGQLFLPMNISGPIGAGGLYRGGLDAAIVAFNNDGSRRFTQVLGTGGDDRAVAVSAGTNAVYAALSLGGDIGPNLMGVPIVGAPKPTGLVLKIQP